MAPETPLVTVEFAIIDRDRVILSKQEGLISEVV